ncbi:MAG: alpha/beta hydrolase [Saprospiraceae bacterium]
MIKIKRKTWLIILAIISILFLGLVLLFLNFSFRQSNEKITKNFREKGIPVEIKTTTSGIRYVVTGNRESDTIVLYIHGAPGSCDAFFTYMQDSALNEKYFQISVDRKGYGYSDYGHAETSIIKQAALLQNILDQYPGKKWIVVGHSFGCAIAAILSIHNKDLIKKIILFGAAADPQFERMVRWASISNTQLVRWISNNDIKVATDEKLSHQRELKIIEPYWKELDCKVVLVHGTKDKLVPFENIEYLQKRINPEKFTLIKREGEGHVVIFMKPDVLKQLLL